MTLNVIFVCKTNDVLAVRKATADEQALDELKALPAEGKPHGVDRCVSPPIKKARLKTDCYKWRRELLSKNDLKCHFCLQNQ